MRLTSPFPREEYETMPDVQVDTPHGTDAFCIHRSAIPDIHGADG